MKVLAAMFTVVIITGVITAKYVSNTFTMLEQFSIVQLQDAGIIDLGNNVNLQATPSNNLQAAKGL